MQRGEGSIDTPAAFLGSEVGKDPKHPSVSLKPIRSEAIVFESLVKGPACLLKCSILSSIYML